MQSVLFTAAYSIDRKIDFASEFVKRSSRMFGNDPSIGSSPQNAPPNVPRLEIKSPDQSHIVHFYPNQVSFMFQDTRNLRTTIKGVFPGFLGGIESEIQSIMEFINPKVTRLGFVTHFIAELGSSANQYISENMLKDNPFPDAHELHFGVLHRLDLVGFPVNRWVRYRSLRAKNDPTADFAMGIDIDINTLAEQVNDFSAGQIIDYFQAGFQHITSNIGDFPFFDDGFESSDGFST